MSGDVITDWQAIDSEWKRLKQIESAARWLVNIHADDIAIPEGSALWEDLQSLKAALLPVKTGAT